ncbi:hypothetical protein [Endozoicomonas arenosclerae]|uniref:hypothetical protein n=1 Tax=Endozoicomonas arenosclerae TaxID=1633495 RepID=UPI000784CFBD|nr:hypothetical protein [Endozoicomonas arenosclerae]
MDTDLKTMVFPAKSDFSIALWALSARYCPEIYLPYPLQIGQFISSIVLDTDQSGFMNFPG